MVTQHLTYGVSSQMTLIGGGAILRAALQTPPFLLWGAFSFVDSLQKVFIV